MDQLGAMKAFARVVEAGSFTRAADSLEIPKPTITKQIQQLEQHLRTKLLNRTTRRVTVTPDGAAYYERAVRLLADVEELDSSLAVAQTRPKGKLRIDMSGSLAQIFVIPALPAFFEKYPDIQIDFGVSDRTTDLIGENVDCVLRAGDLADQSLIARRIAEFPFLTVAAPSYLERMGEPRSPKEIETGHTVVGYFNATTGRMIPFEFVRGDEVLEIRARQMVALNEASAYVAAAVAGLGIAQVPASLVKSHLASGQLRRILVDWSPKALPLHVVYPPNRHLSNKLRVFVDWIANIFARENISTLG